MEAIFQTKTDVLVSDSKLLYNQEQSTYKATTYNTLLYITLACVIFFSIILSYLIVL